MFESNLLFMLKQVKEIQLKKKGFFFLFFPLLKAASGRITVFTAIFDMYLGTSEFTN